jgi:hypothetical protein
MQCPQGNNAAQEPALTLQHVLSYMREPSLHQGDLSQESKQSGALPGIFTNGNERSNKKT